MKDFHVKQKPVSSLVSMGGGAFGLFNKSSGGAVTYVDDVFSTHVYEGTGNSRSITNDIDLSTEGGMVWIKERSSTDSHSLFDTERGATKYIKTDTADSQYTSSSALSAFNTNGFSIAGADGATNASGADYVSWSFRKSPGFFDVVKWDGNGTAGRTVSHNLGSVPGMIIIKSDSTSTYWIVYHRSLGQGQYMLLNNSDSKSSYDSGNNNSRYFNNTAPTSTEFTLSDDGWVNGSGRSYVAYIFAHDEQTFGTDGDEAIIKCGSYTGTGGGTPNLVDLGFEPQWLMVKRADAADNWSMHDMMRGMAATGTQRLKADSDVAESAWGQPFAPPAPTGFIPTANNGEVNSSGGTYIYMAIRRPNKPITDATKLFAIDTYGAQAPSPPTYTSGFPVDFAITRWNINVASNDQAVALRLMDEKMLKANTTGVQIDETAFVFDYMDGFSSSTGTASHSYAWMFRRAPGFFDVATYTGNGSNRTISHNLDAVPQMMIIKRRTNNGESWAVYSATLPASNRLRWNQTGSKSEISSYFNSTAPTSSVFSVGTDTATNANGDDYVAMLFGSLDGISKVGSYTGTNAPQNIDCGFSSGARFVMIKRTDATGDWYLYDSTRGIVSGDDPYLIINSDAAQVTNTDYIDPYSGGFAIAHSAGADLNADGGDFVYLAIA